MVQMDSMEQIGAYLEKLGLSEGPHFTVSEVPVLNGFRKVFSKRFDGELLHYDLTVFQEGETGKYCTGGYTATLFRIPEIRHGILEGIDTADLDRRLGRCDWQKDFRQVASGSRRPLEAFNDLVLLSQLYHRQANRIAGLLMLRHWAGTPLERTVKLDYSLATRTVQHFGLNNDPDDIGALQAYNLLSGRAVLLFEGQEGRQKPSRWVKLLDGELLTYPLFDLAARLRALPLAAPLSDMAGQELTTDLISGGRPQLELAIGGHKVPAFLEADPGAGLLKAFTAGEVPIEIALPARRNAKKQAPGKRRPGWPG